LLEYLYGEHRVSQKMGVPIVMQLIMILMLI